jgi:hypothetical protein
VNFALSDLKVDMVVRVKVPEFLYDIFHLNDIATAHDPTFLTSLPI